MTCRWIAFALRAVFIRVVLIGLVFIGGALAGSAGAAPGDKVDVVRDLAGRVGPVVGAALACRDIARPRIQVIVNKFATVIKEASSNEAERTELTQLLDRTVSDGRRAVTAGQMDCGLADRQLADLERSIAGPSATLPSATLPSAAAPSAAAPAAPAFAAAAAPAAAAGVGAVRGVTDREIRFGISAPFSGPAKELGRQMKLGIDTAFNRVNEAGGVDGRMLKLVAADDGYEPTRTAETMKQLYEKDQVFGIIGNVGTPTATVAVPYALERRLLFFGAFSGANVLRRDPPDRYVFNYRASYAEETDAVVRYLVRVRRIQPKQIAVFAQDDTYGNSGFAGVTKAMRALNPRDSTVVRLGYKRNTVDVDEAVNQLRAQKTPIKAIVMVATYQGRRKVHREDARPLSRIDLHQRLVCRQHRAGG